MFRSWQEKLVVVSCILGGGAVVCDYFNRLQFDKDTERIWRYDTNKNRMITRDEMQTLLTEQKPVKRPDADPALPEGAQLTVDYVFNTYDSSGNALTLDRDEVWGLGSSYDFVSR